MAQLFNSCCYSYDISVLIDTYNVVRVVDRGLEITTAFNVIYIDGVTKLE